MAGAGKVTVDFELRAIVVLENRLHVLADDIGAKLRRDVTEPEAAARIRNVTERRRRREKWLLEASRELAVLRVNVGRREIRPTHHEKEQVLKREHRVAVVKDGELIMPQGVAVAPLVAKDVGEQAVRAGGVRVAGQHPLDAAGGLVEPVGKEMDFAKGHQGGAVVGLCLKISIERGLR